MRIRNVCVFVCACACLVRSHLSSSHFLLLLRLLVFRSLYCRTLDENFGSSMTVRRLSWNRGARAGPGGGRNEMNGPGASSASGGSVPKYDSMSRFFVQRCAEHDICLTERKGHMTCVFAKDPDSTNSTPCPPLFGCWSFRFIPAWHLGSPSSSSFFGFAAGLFLGRTVSCAGNCAALYALLVVHV